VPDRNPRRVTTALAVAALALLAGCAKGERTAKAPLTEAQRDSVLATEPIPGAATVGRALDARQQAAGRAADMDSTAR
jgi:hypothetical protein